MKRLFDIIFSLIGIVILLPIWLIIGFLIYKKDGCPILFKQLRIGRNRKEFTLYKFRTMAFKKGTEAGTFDVGLSDRVTPIGKILRKSKLDELPQLWNVLKGDMSIVGPRPEVKKWTLIYPERWENVLKVNPGITDNASVEFRNEEEILAKSDAPEKIYKEKILPRKLDLYEEYVDNHSLIMDLKIIMNTIAAIIKNNPY